MDNPSEMCKNCIKRKKVISDIFDAKINYERLSCLEAAAKKDTK
jgi:hypothetical protein